MLPGRQVCDARLAVVAVSLKMSTLVMASVCKPHSASDKNSHSTVTARSQRGHSTVTARSQHGHSTVTARSSHGHSTVTARSQHGHRTVTAPWAHGHSIELRSNCKPRSASDKQRCHAQHLHHGVYRTATSLSARANGPKTCRTVPHETDVGSDRALGRDRDHPGTVLERHHVGQHRAARVAGVGPEAPILDTNIGSEAPIRTQPVQPWRQEEHGAHGVCRVV